LSILFKLGGIFYANRRIFTFFYGLLIAKLLFPFFRETAVCEMKTIPLSKTG